MDARLRDVFDLHLETVLAAMPQRIHDLLQEVPLHVEDFPPQNVLDEVGLHDRGALCGLYSGVPISDRSVMQGWRLPDVVTIYREGILNAAAGESGGVSENELQRQIHITVLHELGHHHGLDEDELAELGYG